MKARFKRIILSGVSLVLAFVFSFAIVNSNAALVNAEEDIFVNSSIPSELTPDAMENAVEKFLNVSEQYPNGNRGGRAPFSDSERLMADAILDYVDEVNQLSIEPSYIASKRLFEVNTSDGTEKSQNIVVTKKSKVENAKQVIFISSYDSEIVSSGGIWDIVNGNTDDNKSFETGAMDNATGSAVLYALIDYFKNIDLSIDLVFIFSGASNYYNSGAEAYLELMSRTEMNNTLLVFSFRRFGGDTLYMYNEEVETQHGSFLLELSYDLGLSFNPTPKNMPVINARLINRLPYAHFAMLGQHAPFMQEHILVASFFSAYYSGLNLTDRESKSEPVRSGTKDDTFVLLKEDFPKYKDQMSEAAVLAASAVQSADFQAVMIKSLNEFKNYDSLTQKIVVQFVVIGICGLLVVVGFIISRHFEKKYPNAPKPTKVKIAVFGKDYEEEKEGQHIIELRPINPSKKDDKIDPFG